MLHMTSLAALACLAKADRMDNGPLIKPSGEEILKRIIPSSGQFIPAIGLGTWRVFDAGASRDRRARLTRVLQNLQTGGGTVIDSSPMYGSSETVVGDLTNELQIRNSLFLATKVWTRGREEGIRQMNESIGRMKAGTIDLMQVHNLVDVHTHLPVLRKWKDEGRIKYIGITHYLPSVYQEMMKLIREERLDFIQCNYNIAVRDAERELLPLAKDKGVAVLINRPFNEGGLFDAVRGKPLPAWASDYGIAGWPSFFLKYLLSNPAVTCAIPGTSDPVHMVENLQAGMGDLPDEKTRKRMVAYFDSLL